MTVPELLIVLVIVGALFALAVPPIAASADRAAAHSAAQDVETAFASARDEALARRAITWVVFDTARAIVWIRAAGGGTRSRPVGSIFGVRIASTRDSVSYDGRGLGWGAANVTVVVSRGRVRDSIVVSRLGRVRR
ncbi:MAG TPA: GspH/FimT family protein [Gemmatimonadaceae bacterium]